MPHRDDDVSLFERLDDLNFLLRHNPGKNVYVCDNVSQLMGIHAVKFDTRQHGVM
jgi:hypothetical protein